MAFAFVAAAIGIARSSIGTCSVVQGVSMYPTFKPDDVVQARPVGGIVQRGDVLIISDDRGERVIKRVIGLPGEKVTIHRGFVYINGRRLSEPYLPEHTYTLENDSRILRRLNWKLGNDEFFVLGDNRMESTDSRYFGPVRRANIFGVVELPPNSEKPEVTEVILTGSGRPGYVDHKPASHPPRAEQEPSSSKG